MGLARHTLGIVSLLVTVFLFTASNFLASVSLLEMNSSKYSEQKHSPDYFCGQFVFETVFRQLCEHFLFLSAAIFFWPSAALKP